MHRPARQHVQSVVSVASCGRVLVGRATATQLSRSASSNGSVGLTFGLLCALETRAPVPFRFSQRGSSATVSMCQPGDVALSTPRLADLVVNRDVLKDSLLIKTVDVSTMRPPCDAPCDAPCEAPCELLSLPQCNGRFRRPNEFALLPGYRPHQAPADACFVVEGCLSGLGQRKVHLAVHLATYRQHACQYVYAWCMHGVCMTNVHVTCTRGLIYAWCVQQVLAFSTQIENIGCAPFVIGVPSGYEPGGFDTIGTIIDHPFGRRLSSDGGVDQREQLRLDLSRGGGTTTGRYPSHRRLDNGWSWHDCHQHWHYDNYAHYALRNLCTNEDVAWEDRPVVGHKNGWCVALPHPPRVVLPAVPRYGAPCIVYHTLPCPTATHIGVWPTPTPTVWKPAAGDASHREAPTLHWVCTISAAITWGFPRAAPTSTEATLIASGSTSLTRPMGFTGSR